MHEPSLFLFLVLCKCTTVAAMMSYVLFSVRSCSEWDSPGVIFSLLIRFIIFSLFLSTSAWSLTLSFLPTNSPQTHQSNHAPLWSPLYIHFSVKKKWDASLTKGQNMAHSPCQAYSFSLSGPFYSPVHLCVEQWHTGVQGGGFWQDGNTMTHQSPGEKNASRHQDMCHSPAEAPAFLVVDSPSGDNDEAPICCWDADLSLSEVRLCSSAPFCQMRWSRFTFDTSLFNSCSR